MYKTQKYNVLQPPQWTGLDNYIRLFRDPYVRASLKNTVVFTVITVPLQTAGSLVLAAVIVVACVSLIFNAFNISVAERIKQFGLLSSVGASRRQLRRAVVLEGAIVAVIGIPCGLLIGLAGCAVTFAALGPALAQLAGSVEVPFRVAVNGWVLLVASVLTFVTVLVSVWILSLIHI